jgi:superfamily II DNA or RNA helicase
MAKSTKTKKRQQASKKKALKVPYHYKPDDLTLDAWQKALREQFVQDKYFQITKLDDTRVFGDYKVYNPEKATSYKVALRCLDSSWNFCTCMDFKTNHLGTCKHLEAVLQHVQSRRGNMTILKKGYQPSYSSVYLSYKGRRAVKVRIGHENHTEYVELAKAYFDADLTLKPESFLLFETFLAKAKEINEDFRCYDDALDFILTTRENQRRANLLKEKYPDASHINGVIKATLFPYQKEGVLFAAQQGRAMIADEMGLGKTIQAIAVAELLQKEVLISNVLIVCPTSLKYQWQAEIKKFSNNSSVVIEGLPHIRKEQYKREVFYKIVSYHTLKNDVDVVNQTDVDLVILDEAQRIKNWKTQLAQGVKKINSRYAVVLTGTPLENKLEELYSIVQFIDPFKLGPYHTFLNRYQEFNEAGKIIGYKNLNEIGELLSDIMIRRKKNNVLKDLPERIDKNLLVPMTAEQMDWHTEFQNTVAQLVNKWKRQRFLSEQDRQKLLINLNLMRMVCDSTYIVDETTRFDTKIDELMNILEEYFDGNHEKVVIFSQWARMTRLIASELDARGIAYQNLHGGVPSAKRKELFEVFNNDPQSRVFLSTDAGSTGLNLQSASMLINMDIPWNPAILEQRIARIHRIGQKNNITVLNFVASGTIEHRMLDVLRIKSSLAEGILDQGEDSIFLSDSKFNQFMNSVGNIVDVSEQPDKNPNIITGEEKGEQLEMNFDNTASLTQGPAGSQNTEKEKSDGQKLPVETKLQTRDADEPVRKDFPTDRLTPQKSISEPSELVSQGINFFSGLAKTLSSPEETQKLVQSITEKDEKSGQMYLKIPVESQEAVSQVFNMLGQFFKKI